MVSGVRPVDDNSGRDTFCTSTVHSAKHILRNSMYCKTFVHMLNHCKIIFFLQILVIFSFQQCDTLQQLGVRPAMTIQGSFAQAVCIVQNIKNIARDTTKHLNRCNLCKKNCMVSQKNVIFPSSSAIHWSNQVWETSVRYICTGQCMQSAKHCTLHITYSTGAVDGCTALVKYISLNKGEATSQWLLSSDI